MFTCIQDFLSQNIKIYVYIYIYISLSLSCVEIFLFLYLSVSLSLSLTQGNYHVIEYIFKTVGKKRSQYQLQISNILKKKKKNYNYRRFNAIDYTHVIRHNQWRKGVLLLLAPELGFDPIWFLYTLFSSKYLLPLHK